MSEASFVERFESAAAPVRRWLALRSGLVGLGAGLTVGAALAAGAWALRLDIRPIVAGVGALAGLAASLIWAERRGLSRGELGLYLDRRLGGDEAVSTALEYGAEARGELSPSARDAVLERAACVLSGYDARKLRPRVLSRWHALVPAGLAAALTICLVPMRAAPPVPPAAPGVDEVAMTTAPQIDRVIEELDRMTPRDAAEAQRLDALRAQAKAIKEKLAKGAPRRELMSEVGELSSALARERLSMGEGAEKQGFEDALAKLDTKELSPARRALADHDLTAFDAEMAKLAEGFERESRERAKQSLEEAAADAEKGGAPDVAKLLREKKKQLDERGAKSDEAKRLAEALAKEGGDEAMKQAAESLSKGDPAARKEALQALEKALSEMSEAHRKKLAEALAKQAAQGKKDGTLSPEDQKQLEELAKKLDSAEGREALKKALEELAKNPPPSGDAERQENLKQMELSLEGLKQALEKGGAPGDGNAPDKGNPPPSGTGNGSDGAAKPGPAGTGAGGISSAGPSGKQPGKPSDKLSGKELRARASAELNPGAPTSINKTTRAGARPGETANKAGTGALGDVGADEVGGVTRSEVPEEYREQVGRYFQP